MRPHRRILIAAAFACCAMTAYGGNGNRWLSVHFGAEWGIGWSMMSKSHETYLVSDGFLVDIREVKFRQYINGAVLGFVEADFGGRVGVAASSGYMGLYRNERVVPVMLRTSFALKRNGMENGGAVFIEGGPGFAGRQDMALIGRGGYAYRCRLAGHLAVDFRASFLISDSHPAVYDRFSGRYVPDEDLRTTDWTNAGIMFTIGIVF